MGGFGKPNVQKLTPDIFIISPKPYITQLGGLSPLYSPSFSTAIRQIVGLYNGKEEKKVCHAFQCI